MRPSPARRPDRASDSRRRSSRAGPPLDSSSRRLARRFPHGGISTIGGVTPRAYSFGASELSGFSSPSATAPPMRPYQVFIGSQERVAKPRREVPRNTDRSRTSRSDYAGSLRDPFPEQRNRTRRQHRPPRGAAGAECSTRKKVRPIRSQRLSGKPDTSKSNSSDCREESDNDQRRLIARTSARHDGASNVHGGPAAKSKPGALNKIKLATGRTAAISDQAPSK